MSDNDSDREDVGEIDSRFSNDAVPAYTWQELFKHSSNEYTSFVESIETAFDLMKKYELETTTKFSSSYKSDQIFGRRGKLYLGTERALKRGFHGNWDLPFSLEK